MRTICAAAAGVAILLGLSSPVRADESAEDYVRRMAEAGLPEMAEARAEEVLSVDLAEPVSTAVVAAMRAKRGDAEGAMVAIATAVLFGPDEPYVRRTAGQLLAWHDTRSGTMADDVESSLETMRRTVGETPECADAYRVARDAYLAARSVPAGTPPAGATLVADSVEADFAADADTDVVIFTVAVTSACGWGNHVSPSCGVAWCSAVVRGCRPGTFDAGRSGTRFAAERVYLGRYGSSRGFVRRAPGGWSTPLGTFSRSVPRAGWYGPSAACAPAPTCSSPRSCE